MQIQNAIKRLSKHGKVIQDRPGSYYAIINGCEVSFLANGDDRPDNSICCERCRRLGDEDDIQSDYWGGSFYDNLTQAIRAAYLHYQYENPEGRPEPIAQSD